MKGFVKDIEGLAVKNAEFRRVLYTAKHCQLVLMTLKPQPFQGGVLSGPRSLLTCCLI